MANARPGTIRPSYAAIRKVDGLLPAFAKAAGVEVSGLKSRRSLYQAARRFLEAHPGLEPEPLAIEATAGKQRPDISAPGYRASAYAVEAYRASLRQFWKKQVGLVCRTPAIAELAGLAMGIFEGRRVPVEVTPLNRLPWRALEHAATIVSPAPEYPTPREDFLNCLAISCVNNPHGIVPRTADAPFKAAILQRLCIKDAETYELVHFDVAVYLGHDERTWLVAAPAKSELWDGVTRRSEVSAVAEARAREIFMPAPLPDGETVGLASDGQKIRAEILHLFNGLNEPDTSGMGYRIAKAMTMSAFDAVYLNASDHLANAWKALHPWAGSVDVPRLMHLQLAEMTVSPDEAENRKVQTAVIRHPYLFRSGKISGARGNVHVMAMEHSRHTDIGIAPERTIQSSSVMERIGLRFDDATKAGNFLLAHAAMKSMNPHFRLASAAEGERLAAIPAQLKEILSYDINIHLLELAGRAMTGSKGIGKFTGEDDSFFWMAEQLGSCGYGGNEKQSRPPVDRRDRMKLATWLFLKKAEPGGLAAFKRLGRLWHDRIDEMKEEERRLFGGPSGSGPALPDFSGSIPDGWTVTQLRDAVSLSVEGRQMGHCVGSYDSRVRAGDNFILAFRGPDGSRSTAELRIDPAPDGDQIILATVQHQGPKNGPISQSHRDVLQDIVSLLKEDGQRPEKLLNECREAREREYHRADRYSARLMPEIQEKKSELAWAQLAPFIPKRFAKLPVNGGIDAILAAYAEDEKASTSRFEAANGRLGKQHRQENDDGKAFDVAKLIFLGTTVEPPMFRDAVVRDSCLDDDFIPF